MGGYVNKTPIFTLPAGTYTTSKEIALRDYTGDSMINYGRGTFTLENDTPITDVAIATNNGVKGENYPMLCKGSALLDWEPYTGGQPSPNPDYPQEIKSVVNPKVTVSGAQLQSKGGNNYNKNGITVDYVNGTEITIKGTATASVNTVGLFLKNLKENTTYTLSLYGIDFTKINAILGHSGKLSNVSKTFNSGLYTKRFLDFTIEEGTTVDCTFKLMLNEGSTALPYEPYKEQVATLPYELNAIPVSSGGNVTIDGQQYVADYVDVERGKLVRMVDDLNLDATVPIVDNTDMLLATPIEIDLTDEEVQLFKDLSTYYPHTHVMVKSEQLDGYTTFNYPISLANGWNYVKEQLGDTREFIYDMELQSAEAYVNSEYAVAIAELEV